MGYVGDTEVAYILDEENGRVIKVIVEDLTGFNYGRSEIEPNFLSFGFKKIAKDPSLNETNSAACFLLTVSCHPTQTASGSLLPKCFLLCHRYRFFRSLFVIGVYQNALKAPAAASCFIRLWNLRPCACFSGTRHC